MNFIFKKSKGVTLMEVLVVLGILSVFAGFVFMGLGDFRNKNELKAGSELVLSVIQEARQRTLSSENLSQYGVHLESGEIIEFTGSSYNQNDVLNEVNEISDRIIISHSINGGGDDIVFERLSGQTQNYGTIQISVVDDNTQTKTIVIEKTGIIYEQ